MLRNGWQGLSVQDADRDGTGIAEVQAKRTRSSEGKAGKATKEAGHPVQDTKAEARNKKGKAATMEEVKVWDSEFSC